MRSTPFCLAGAISLTLAWSAWGAEVSFVGAEVDGTAADWRTSSVDKPFDIDGDNIYGTYAAVHWTVQGNYSGSTISFVSSGSQFRNPGYSLVDHLPDEGATDTLAGIVLNQHTFQVNADLRDQILRVGVMHDVLSAGEHAADFGWSASLTQTVSGSGGTTGASATSSILPGANGIVDMLFFDITGASVGDRFQIAGISNEGRAQNPYLSHVTWDIVQVANPIRIEVFTNTGVVNIVGSDTFDYEINGYSVSSAGGSLDTSQWNSLQDQGFGDGNTDPNDGIGWEQLGDGTANLVGEFNLQGSTVVGPNGVSMATLGRLFSIGGTEDLEVELSLANGSSLMPNVVYLTATSVPGDYNGDGTVDAADYTVWRDTLGQSVAEGTGADGSANGIIDAADYGVWRSQFGNSASSGSLSSAPAVPEPTTFCLVAGLGLLVANVARFKRSA